MPEASPDLVRCPRCGAGNPAAAEWCGQCLTRFEGPDIGEPDGEPSGKPESSLPEMDREGEALVWTCPACEASNPIESSACARCGSPFVSFFAKQEKPPVRTTSPARAAALSAVLPGLAHWSLGRGGAGAARGLLYLWSIGLSVLLLVRPPANGGGLVRLVGVVFLVSAVGIWFVAMLEAMRLAEGDRHALLPPHALTWVSAGLTLLLFAGLVGSAVSARGTP